MLLDNLIMIDIAYNAIKNNNRKQDLIRNNSYRFVCENRSKN